MGCCWLGGGSNEAFWLAVDDEALYLDRNQDGAFAGDDERIPWARREADQQGAPVEVGSLGGSSYQVSLPASESASESESTFLAKQTSDWQSLDRTRLSIRQIDLDDSETIDLWLDPSWEEAPITHVTGFLQPGLKWKDDTFLSRSQDNKFEIQIGVSRPFAGEPSRRSFPTLLHREFSADVYPIAVFRYPHRDGTSGPIEQEVHLRERC